MHLSFCSTQCIDCCSVRGDVESERFKLLEDICSLSNQFPKSYWLDNVSKGVLISKGGEASVHRGAHRGHDVVIRKLHCFSQSASEQSDLMMVRTDVPLSYLGFANRGIGFQLFIREVISHWQLRHPNIVALKGICKFGHGPLPSMILQHAQYPSAREYLMLHSDSQSYMKVVRILSRRIF